MNTRNFGILALLGALVIGVVLITSCGKEPEKATEAKESPAEIYAKYNQAIKNMDRREMKKYASSARWEVLNEAFPEDLSQLPEDQRELAVEMIEWIKSETAKDYEVVRQEIESDKGKAGLYLKREDSDIPYGLVTFIKVNGAWKIDTEDWSNIDKYDIDPPSDSQSVDIAAFDILFVQKGEGEADLEAIIKNNGEANISGLSYTFSINESEEAGSLPVFGFGPGKEFILDLSHSYSNYYRIYLKDESFEKPFELKMVLVLDPEDELKESNEENNQIIKTFYIRD